MPTTLLSPHRVFRLSYDPVLRRKTSRKIGPISIVTMADMKKNWPKTLRLQSRVQCNKAATYCIDHTDPELYIFCKEPPYFFSNNQFLKLIVPFQRKQSFCYLKKV